MPGGICFCGGPAPSSRDGLGPLALAPDVRAGRARRRGARRRVQAVLPALSALPPRRAAGAPGLAALQDLRPPVSPQRLAAALGASAEIGGVDAACLQERPELAEPGRLDLPDALAAVVEPPADRLQRLRLFAVQPESPPQY